jgi:hypothetical protein
MATITLTTVSGTQTTRVADAICTRFGYTGFESDGITPQTKLEFVRRHLINYLKEQVAIHESEQAASTARNTSLSDVQNNISIT